MHGDFIEDAQANQGKTHGKWKRRSYGREESFSLSSSISSHRKFSKKRGGLKLDQLKGRIEPKLLHIGRRFIILLYPSKLNEKEWNESWNFGSLQASNH
ncbi:hypothetical protein V6N13_073085 [Hibiscus sabdariffa]|uniref:Uncharacterized protein n=1 Tax=Hibiscus sabdariffa TaxID=183260 RepID=A0ABR2E831_9ROSI